VNPVPDGEKIEFSIEECGWKWLDSVPVEHRCSTVFDARDPRRQPRVPTPLQFERGTAICAERRRFSVA
jgi:hypothetical protein